jgi:hypothetical protein
MEPVQLTEDEAVALAQAMRAEQRAQQDAEAAVLRVAHRDAVDAKMALLSKLATTHGFDAAHPYAFDLERRQLIPRNGHGHGQ